MTPTTEQQDGRFFASDGSNNRAGATDTPSPSRAVSVESSRSGLASKEITREKAWTGESLSDWLRAELERRKRSFAYNENQWHVSAKRLLEDFSGDQIVRVAEYAMGDDFWQARVISMPLLKQHFATLFNQVAQLDSQRGPVLPGSGYARGEEWWFNHFRALLDPAEWSDEEVREEARHRAEQEG